MALYAKPGRVEDASERLKNIGREIMIKRSYRALSISTKTFSEIMKLHGTAWHCTEIEVVSFTKQQQFFSLNDILSGDTHKWGLNLSSKADSVTKTNNQIIEET